MSLPEKSGVWIPSAKRFGKRPQRTRFGSELWKKVGSALSCFTSTKTIACTLRKEVRTQKVMEQLDILKNAIEEEKYCGSNFRILDSSQNSESLQRFLVRANFILSIVEEVFSQCCQLKGSALKIPPKGTPFGIPIFEFPKGGLKGGALKLTVLSVQYSLSINDSKISPSSFTS